MLKVMIEMAEKFKKEIDIKDKRISLLEESIKRRQNDIETLNAEINRQNNIIVDYMNTNASLRELAAEEKKVIKATATWISEQDIDEVICKHKHNSECPDGPDLYNEKGFETCIECIINHFKESEVKE